MKKVSALILALAMCTAMLTACGRRQQQHHRFHRQRCTCHFRCYL